MPFLEYINMLVNIACLQGKQEELSRAKLLGEFKDIEVTNTDPIITKITQIYTHPESPYPCLGTVKATMDGFIIPQVGDCFFWITIAQGGPVILEDFGSGENRLDRFNSICSQQMSKATSIWSFASLWEQSHHKTSIERLVSYYVHSVTNQLPVAAYASWLGAKGAFLKHPLDQTRTDTYFVGIDMSFMDNTSNIVGLLENHLCNNVLKTKLSRTEEHFIRKFVAEYIRYKSLDRAMIVAKHDGIAENRFEAMCKEIGNMYNRIAGDEKKKKEFINNQRNLK